MQYLNAIFDALNVCLMLVDEKGGVKKVNNAVAVWLGKDVADCCGKGPGNAFDCVHALSSAACGSSPHCPECPIRRAFETALREDRPVHNVEVSVTMRRGGREERLWLDVSVDPLTINGRRHAVISLNNITEIKRAQEVLRRDKETLEKLVQETANELKVRYAMLQRAEEVGLIGCWLLDMRGDELVWSDQVFSIFGMPRGKLSYADFLALVHPEDRAYVGQKWQAALAGDLYDIEHRIVTPGGEVKWVREKAELEFDASGKPARGIGVVQDISSRKRWEQEHDQLQREMTRVARHALLGEFSSALAHELNQPLAAILSNAQAAKRFLSGKAPDIAEVREIVDDIVSDTGRAGDIIRKLRLLLNKGELSLKRTDICGLLRETAAFVKNELMLRGINLHLECGAARFAMADATQIQQVFLNLIRNACEALEGCPRRDIWVSSREAEGHITVAVRDSGRGFASAPEDIFKPFYTTKSSGMGMGLAISKRIVESHGGRIIALSVPQGGAELSVELPAAKEEGQP